MPHALDDAVQRDVGVQKSAWNILAPFTAKKNTENERLKTNILRVCRQQPIVEGTPYMSSGSVAKEAVDMLIKGSMHGTVYRFLHGKRRELKKKKLEI